MELPARFSRALGLQRKAGPITSLHIFDFDGTLVRTPGPEEGKRKYMLETGKPWSGGWWGKPGSLSPPVVESPFPQSLVINTAFNEMEEVITRSQTAVAVVVTGRIKPLRPAVLRILEEVCIATRNDTVKTGESFLHPEAVFTHPGGRYTTLEYKKALFKTLLTTEPLSNCPIQDLHIWEDRKEHAEVFASETTDLLRRLKGVNTVVHFVPKEAP